MDVQKSMLPDLAIVRQKSGVSLAEIAANTKIAVSYLRAIEEGDWQVLPHQVYVKSYVRNLKSNRSLFLVQSCTLNLKKVKAIWMLLFQNGEKKLTV